MTSLSLDQVTDKEALKDHDRNLTRDVLTCCQHKGNKFNVDKMQFRKKEVTYMGQVVSNKTRKHG